MAARYLITGASSDVGVLLLSRLLEQQPDAQVTAQGCGDLAGLAPLCAAFPGRIETHDVNLADAEAREAFVGEILADGAPFTHFVHLPALRVVNTRFKKFDEERFLLDMQVQALSAAAICRGLAPAMAKARFGRILFMLSSYVLGAPPKNTAAYVMAKQALWGLAKSLAADYAHAGVTVNCVAPSMMETKFLADTPRLIVEGAAAQNPMGRLATPADVVPAMAFLLSDEARFITGVLLPVTGGEVMAL